MQRPRQHPYRRKPAVLWLYAAVGINYQRLPFSQIANYDTSPPPQMNCLRYVKVLWSTQIGLENMLRKTTTGYETFSQRK